MIVTSVIRFSANNRSFFISQYIFLNYSFREKKKRDAV